MKYAILVNDLFKVVMLYIEEVAQMYAKEKALQGSGTFFAT